MPDCKHGAVAAVPVTDCLPHLERMRWQRLVRQFRETDIARVLRAQREPQRLGKLRPIRREKHVQIRQHAHQGAFLGRMMRRAKLAVGKPGPNAGQHDRQILIAHADLDQLERARRQKG